jgi:hypothetical protein
MYWILRRGNNCTCPVTLLWVNILLTFSLLAPPLYAENLHDQELISGVNDSNLIQSRPQGEKNSQGIIEIPVDPYQDKIIGPRNPIPTDNEDGSEDAVTNSNEGKSVEVDVLTVTTTNKIQAGIEAENGSRVSVGDVELSNVEADSVAIDTKNTVSGKVEAKEGGEFQLGTVKLQNFRGESAKIEAENEMRGNVSSQQGSTVSIGNTNIGNVEDQQEFMQNRGSLTEGARPNNLLSSKGADIKNPEGQEPIVPEMPGMPDYYPGMDESIWAALGYAIGDLLTSEDLDELYRQMYNDAQQYYSIAEIALARWEKALKNGDDEQAEYFKEQYYRNLDIFNSFNEAASSVRSNNLDGAYAKAEAAYKIIKTTSKIVAAASGIPGADKAMDLLYLGLDFGINSSEKGIKYAGTEIMEDVIIKVLINTSFGGTSLADHLDNGAGDLVGKSGFYQDLSILVKSETSKQEIMKSIHSVLEETVVLGADEGWNELDKLANSIANQLSNQLASMQ